MEQLHDMTSAAHSLMEYAGVVLQIVRKTNALREKVSFLHGVFRFNPKCRAPKKVIFGKINLGCQKVCLVSFLFGKK